ncbi:MAG: mechanosensitive ion channel family protein [Phycisphaerales bacterium]|jgi:MscS family membrane protein|nr:mechanosensitive ion channel family protein [Phycisphaerales bacterium]
MMLAILSGVALAATSAMAAMPPPPTPPPADAATTTPPPIPDAQASPQVVLEFLLEADSSVGAPAVAGCFTKDALPPTTAVRDRVVRDFRNALTWLGWNQTTSTSLPKADDASMRTVIFPATETMPSAIRERSAALEKRIGGTWRVEIVRGEDGGYRFAKEAVASTNLDAALDAIAAFRRERNGTPEEEQARPTNLAEWVNLHGADWMLERFVFLAIWQWIGLGLVILVGIVIDTLTRFIARRAFRSVNNRIEAGPDDDAIRRASRSIGIVAGTLTWLLLINLLELPIAGLAILQPAAQFAFVLALLWAGWRGIDLLADLIGARVAASENKLDDILVPMVRKTAKVLLVTFGLLNVAPILGLNLGPLLAAVGIGSFGFAFAFKNSLENLFGSVTVILDRPFLVGDWVVIDGVEGTVEDVGLRSTKVRTFYNSLVSIPNSNLITKQVDNYGARKYRRWSTKVGILYGTPPARIDAFCEGIRELVRQHPYTRKDYYQVWLNGFADSALEVLVYVFWEAPDWQTELRERHRLMLDIMRIADELGIDFAFPTRTLHVRRADPNTEPKNAGLDKDDPSSARRTGRVATRDVIAGDDWLGEKPPPYNFLSADETKRLDEMTDEERADAIETRLARKNSAEVAAEAADHPDHGSEKADFTEQRQSGGE